MAKPAAEARNESKNRSAVVLPKETVSKTAKRLNLDPEELVKANPGLTSVVTGQVLKLPGIPQLPNFTPPATPGVINSPYSGNAGLIGPVQNRPPTTTTQTYAGYTGTAGYWGQYNAPKTNGTLSPDKQYQVTGQSQSTLSPDKQYQVQARVPNRTPAPAFPSQSTVTPKYNNMGGVMPTSTPVPRPNTQYTGDPNDPSTRMWRDYWNAAAANPVQYYGTNPPPVWSKEEIQRMKWEQRQRGWGEDTGGASYQTSQPFVYGQDFREQPAPQYAPEQIRTITWGI